MTETNTLSLRWVAIVVLAFYGIDLTRQVDLQERSFRKWSGYAVKMVAKTIEYENVLSMTQCSAMCLGNYFCSGFRFQNSVCHNYYDVTKIERNDTWIIYLDYMIVQSTASPITFTPVPTDSSKKSCSQLVNQALSYSEAVAKCVQLLGKRGRLFVIKTEENIDLIHQQMKSQNIGKLWIGLNSNGTNMTWVDGTVFEGESQFEGITGVYSKNKQNGYVTLAGASALKINFGNSVDVTDGFLCEKEAG